MRRALDFLNLVDREGRLSLSNLILLGAVIYTVYGSVIGLTLEMLSPLILALLNYGFKRHQNRLSYPISELQVLREELIQTRKLAEEAKHLASKATFNRGRRPDYE